MPDLYLIWNHIMTAEQRLDALSSLGVRNILEMPPEIAQVWGQIPPSAVAIRPLLEPVRQWLAAKAVPSDYVLIQGDFGACYLMVQFASERGLVPLYSTTNREASENRQADGSVDLSHRFRHVIFRKYGV